MTETTTVTIGCDLGDKQSEMCVLSQCGKVVERATVKTTKAGMKKFLAGRPQAMVVIEVGAHSRWVSKLVKELGHEVVVANARRVQLICQSTSKNDRADAQLLARLGRADVRLLAQVHHRNDQAHADLKTVHARDALVRTRSALVNVVRGMVKSTGERIRDCSTESFHTQAAEQIPVALREALEPVMNILQKVTEQIRVLERKIGKLAQERYPETARLTQVHGVGVVTALAFVLTLEDSKRFSSSRAVGAFLGMRPRQDQSGETDKQLRITKAGDPYVRRLLVNCANYILGPFGQDSDLRGWGLKLAERGGKNARKRAKVAVARKLAVMLHRLWVSGEHYEPIGYAQKKRAA